MLSSFIDAGLKNPNAEARATSDDLARATDERLASTGVPESVIVTRARIVVAASESQAACDRGKDDR
ncbi:hypothetical protein RLW55_04215 [Hyphomicrobium sp. B1]|uniref:hypothetical protein n=1 Tax=unclassified Hyphomicrobium TaxID=2619925 RepID=UPI0039C4D1EE